MRTGWMIWAPVVSLATLGVGCGDDGGETTTGAVSGTMSTTGPTSGSSTTTTGVTTTTTTTTTATTTTSTAGPTSDPSETETETGTSGGPIPVDWQRGLGSVNFVRTDQVAVGPDGSVAIAGYHAGPTNFGAGNLQTQNFVDIYVVVYDAIGDVTWQRGLSTGITPMGTDTLQVGVTFDASGDVLVTGPFENPTDFGSGERTPEGPTDVFVARYTPTGSLEWVQTFGGPGQGIGAHIVSDDAGDIYVTGMFDVSITAGVTLDSFDPDRTDIFFFKLDSAGEPVWAQSFGSTLDQAGHRVAVAANGDVLLYGEAYGSLDLGGGEVEIPCCSWSSFIARYGSDGVFQWATVLGGAGAFERDGLALADDGSIYAASGEIGLTKLDPDGVLLWSHELPDVRAHDVAATPQGGVWLIGRIDDDAVVDFGDGMPESADGRTGALIEYDADGGVLAKHLYAAFEALDGDPIFFRPHGLAAGPGGVLVSTYESGNGAEITVDLGLGEVEGAGIVVHRAPGF